MGWSWLRSGPIIGPMGIEGNSLTRGRLRGIEGLRAGAAGSIVVYHVWLYGSPGGAQELGYVSRFILPHLAVGVTLFFTLSGYLLYRPIAGALLDRRPVPHVRRYLRHRAMRILPAYWVILALVAIVLPAAITGSGGLGRLAGDPAILFANAALLQNVFPRSLDTGIGPAWSLAVEVGFYLTLPLLALLAAACSRRVRTRPGRIFALLAPVAVMLLVGAAAKAAGQWLLPPGSGAAHDILVRHFLSYADLFAPGMAVAVGHVAMLRWSIGLPRWWSPTLGVGLVATVIAVVLLDDRAMLWKWGLTNPYQRMTALACALLLALVVLPQRHGTERDTMLVRLLEWRPLALAGLASYSLFLWHEPVIRSLEAQGWTSAGTVGFAANLAIAAGISGGLAALTYLYVERPALRRKDRSSARRRVRDSLRVPALPRLTALPLLHRRTAPR